MVSSTSRSSSSDFEEEIFSSGKQEAQSSVDEWIEAVGSNQRLVDFLTPFRELEAKGDPKSIPFFGYWNYTITSLFQGRYKKEAAEILELLWCLFDYFPEEKCQQRFSELISSSNPMDSICQLGMLAAYCKNGLYLGLLPAYLKNEKASQSQCFQTISSEYLRHFQVRLEYFVDNIPCSDPCIKEMAMHTELGRLLASALIDQRGRVNRGAVRYWSAHLPTQFTHLPEPFKHQIVTILHALLVDQDLVDLLESIGPPCQRSELDIRLQLQRESNTELTQADSKQAVLSSLLSYHRQGRSDCYADASIIALVKHDPKRVVEKFKEMIEKGEFKMPKLYGHKDLGSKLVLTHHCKYGTQPMKRSELFDSPPLRFALEDLEMEPSLERQDEMVDPETLLLEEIRKAENKDLFQMVDNHRKSQNRLSSYFEDHFMTTLINHVIYFSNNYLGLKAGVKWDLIDYFSKFNFIPQELEFLKGDLQTLSPHLRSHLEKNLFIVKEDRFSTLLEISKDSKISIDELLEGVWGTLIYFDEASQAMKSVVTWRDLHSLIFYLSIEILKQLKNSYPQYDWTPAVWALSFWRANFDGIEPGFIEISKENARYRGQSNPDQLTKELNLCIFYCKGGNAKIILEEFFALKTQRFFLEESVENPLEQLSWICDSLKAHIPQNPSLDSTPITVCSLKVPLGRHQFNLLPYNHSLKEIWTKPFHPSELLSRGSYKSTVEFSRTQAQILIENLARAIPPDALAQAIAALEPLSETVPPTAETIVAQWEQNPSLKNYLPIMQLALNQTVERLDWNEWDQIIHQLSQLFTNRSYNASKKLYQQLQEHFVLHTNKERSKNDGMSIDQGARILYKSLVKFFPHCEYNQILWHIHHILGFPHKILLGDLNYSKNNELWVGYQYGREKIGFYIADQNGDATSTKGELNLEVLYIVNKPAPLALNPSNKI